MKCKYCEKKAKSGICNNCYDKLITVKKLKKCWVRLREKVNKRGIWYARGRKINMKKSMIIILFVLIICVSLTGCTQNEKVSYNLSQEADNFNIVRQLTVVNCLQGDVIFQMTGKMAIVADRADNQLEIVVEDENRNYQKHFIGLSDNVTYTVEQKQYKNVDNYKYTLNFNPKMWMPINIETID